METIKFDLTSPMAIIRKPDSNETYYTYNFPHKIMLLGILGSIIGLNGYNYQLLQKNLGKKAGGNPEFYEELKEYNEIKDTPFSEKLWNGIKEYYLYVLIPIVAVSVVYGIAIYAYKAKRSDKN